MSTLISTIREATQAADRLSIAIIAPARYPMREPFAGGLEAFCFGLVRMLRERGHHVDLFASRGSQGHVPELEFPCVDWRGYDLNPTDTGYPPGAREVEDAAFYRLRDHLLASSHDIVHNNSLHPVLFGIGAEVPLLTTLHTPPVPELQEAVAAAGPNAGHFAAVSRTTAESWVLPRPATVLRNGVDCRDWRPGPGGDTAVWFGRIVPEKAPHLAVDACRRAGLNVVLAGRIGDQRYWSAEVLPRLGTQQGCVAEYAGQLKHRELAELVGHSSVAVVSPVWDEPFGLVVTEAMACGTPVAAFARGGIVEIIDESSGVLAAPEDVEDLSRAIIQAQELDRNAVRHRAVEAFSSDLLTDRYLDLYNSIRRSRGWSLS